MSDYKDPRGMTPRILAAHGLPHICGMYGEPAKATVNGGELTMHIPLPRAYPAAWVSTPRAWTLVKFRNESDGDILAELFRGGPHFTTLGSKVIDTTKDVTVEIPVKIPERMFQKCHCYDHCEDDDEGVPRRLDCRLRET